MKYVTDVGRGTRTMHGTLAHIDIFFVGESGGVVRLGIAAPLMFRNI